MKEKLLTVEETAEILRTTSAQVHNLVSEGADIPRSVKVGRRRLWPASEINNWIQRQLEASNESNKSAVAKITAKTINRI